MLSAYGDLVRAGRQDIADLHSRLTDVVVNVSAVQGGGQAAQKP